MDSREAQYRNPAGVGDAGKNRGGDYEAGFSTVGVGFGKCWVLEARQWWGCIKLGSSFLHNFSIIVEGEAVQRCGGSRSCATS
jgi:hypothetical protein